MEPLGQEFVLIRPSFAGFRAEMQAQLAAALAGIQPELAAAQARLTRTAGSTATLAGLPALSTAAAGAQQRLASASTAVASSQSLAASSQTRLKSSTQELSKTIRTAEQDTGRFSRGLIASAAASSGLFRAVTFASGAFLVGAGLGATLGAGVQEFKRMTIVAAQSAALIRATGGAANVTADQVGKLATHLQNLTGIDDENIRSGQNILLTFKAIRNEVGAGNDVFNRATQAMLDISTVMGVDLNATARQLGKALQEPTTGLTALRRQGITFSAAQRELVKSLVQSGQILTAQKFILKGIEDQVGGTAQAVGKTLPGELAILRERTKNALGEFVKRVSESQATTDTFKQSMRGLTDAVKNTAGVIIALLAGITELGTTIANLPGVKEFVQGIGSLASAVGGIRGLTRALATLGLTYAGLRLAILAVNTAQRAYIAWTSAATAATAGQVAAGAAATERIGFMAAATRTLTGTVGIAAGLAVLTLALVKMREAAANAPGSLNATRDALRGLSSAVAESQQLVGQAAGARENVNIGQLNVQAAQRASDAAARAIATSNAPAGSLQMTHLLFQQANADKALRDAENSLGEAIQKRDRILERARILEAERPTLIGKTTQALREQIQATLRGSVPKPLIDASRLPLVGGVFGGGPKPIPLGNTALPISPASINAFTAQMQKLAESGNQVERAVGGALFTIRETLDKLPTNKQITVAIRLAGEGASANTIVRMLLGLGQGGEQIRLRGLANVAGPGQQEEEAFLAAKAHLAEQNKILVAARKTAQTRNQELATIKATVVADKDALTSARDALDSATRSLSDARRAYRDAVQTLADTIKQAHQSIAQAITDSRRSVTQAVQAAKDNLQSLGQQLSSTLGDFAAAGGRFGPNLTGKLSGALAQARATILAGKGGPETQQAAAQIAFRLQGTGANTADLQKKFDDLSFDLSSGAIKNMREFNRRLNAIIGNLDPQKLKATLGSAAAGQFLANLQAFRQQAARILAGPQRPGGPGAPQVISPAEALRQGAKSIHDARVQATKDINAANRAVGDAAQSIKDAEKQVQRAHKDLADALDKLRKDSVAASKAQTTATKANTKAANALAGVIKARTVLNPNVKQKDKGQGDANKNSTAVTSHNAGPP